MYKEHLQYLVCPSCKDQLCLEIKKIEGEFIKEGELHCKRCLHKYVITNGIPRFVQQKTYADSFGFEWNMHKKTQHDDKSGVAASKKRFFEETRWSEATGNTSCIVLEAGCGSGRFTPYALSVAGGGGL